MSVIVFMIMMVGPVFASEYVVQKDDCLWKLASKALGTDDPKIIIKSINFVIDTNVEKYPHLNIDHENDGIRGDVIYPGDRYDISSLKLTESVSFVGSDGLVAANEKVSDLETKLNAANTKIAKLESENEKLSEQISAMKSNEQELQKYYDDEIHNNGELRDQISALEDENRELSEKVSTLELGMKINMRTYLDQKERINQLQKEVDSVNAKFSEVEGSYNKIKELEGERNLSLFLIIAVIIFFSLILYFGFEPKTKKGVKTEDFKKERQGFEERDKEKSPPKENSKNIFKVLSKILKKDIKENDKVPIGALAKALIELKMFIKEDENKLIIEIKEICEKMSYLTGAEPGDSSENEIKFTTNRYNLIMPALLEKEKTETEE